LSGWAGAWACTGLGEPPQTRTMPRTVTPRRLRSWRIWFPSMADRDHPSCYCATSTRLPPGVFAARFVRTAAVRWS